MALTYHGGVIVPSKLEYLAGVAYLFGRRGPTSLARCAGHRGIPRSRLGGDQGGTGDGLRDPHRRRDGLAPSRAHLLGRRRLRARGSLVGKRRVLPGAARPEPPVQAWRRRALRKS